MCIDPEGTPEQLQIRGASSYKNKSFEDVIEEEIEELKQLGVVVGYSESDSSEECTYELFKEKFLSTRRKYTHGGHSCIARGLYALQLEPWIAEFGCDNTNNNCIGEDIDGDEGGDGDDVLSKKRAASLKVMTIGQIKGNHSDIQLTMDEVYRFVGLPEHDLQEHEVEAKNTREYPAMSVSARKRLEEFYEPFNQRLYKLVGWQQTDNVNW